MLIDSFKFSEDGQYCYDRQIDSYNLADLYNNIICFTCLFIIIIDTNNFDIYNNFFLYSLVY
jgi:hypothetical protein